MTKLVLVAVALVGGSSAFGASTTFFCTPTSLTNGTTSGPAVQFNLFNGNNPGTGSFNCSAALGSVILSSVTLNIFTDYEFGDGANDSVNRNSASFQMTATAGTWANAVAGITTTMNLNTGLSLFTIGDSGSRQSTFTNTTSGGLGGTVYTLPATEAMSGALTSTFSVNATGAVDAGSFTAAGGDSKVRIQVTYSYTAITTSTPEPGSSVLLGSGLLLLSLAGYKKFLSEVS
jgi:hypothetical protein